MPCAARKSGWMHSMVLKMYSGVRIMMVTFIRVMSGYGSGQRRHEGMPPYDAQFRRT